MVDWRVGVAMLFLGATACGGGGGSSSSPTAPSSTSTTTTTQVTVTNLSASASTTTTTVGQTVTVIATATYSDGTSATVTPTWTSSNTAVATVSASGTVTALAAGTTTVTATAGGRSGTVAITVSVASAGSFSAGLYLVGSQVTAGRYYNDSSRFCYWKRLSGVGGTTSEVIEYAYILGDAGQLIVDIKATDFAFETNSDCGTWYDTPRHGLQANITAGEWLVGDQIPSGRYFTEPASYGCFWTRLSGASGASSEVIEYDYVGDAGQLIVDIQASDEIFSSNDDCGTWTTTAPHGVQTSITPGVWLVNDQVQPGTYSASTVSGCTWYRLSGFEGNYSEIIAWDYVGGGQTTVSILASDEGFYTNDDCGTWTLLE